MVSSLLLSTEDQGCILTLDKYNFKATLKYILLPSIIYWVPYCIFKWWNIWLNSPTLQMELWLKIDTLLVEHLAELTYFTGGTLTENSYFTGGTFGWTKLLYMWSIDCKLLLYWWNIWQNSHTLQVKHWLEIWWTIWLKKQLDWGTLTELSYFLGGTLS